MELNEILRFPAIKNADEFMKEGEGNPFYKQAKALMCEYWIRKVSGGKTRYYFINDIELYYYSKGHEDRYTHVHFYEGEKFRIHQFGVDITFDSHNETVKNEVKAWFEKEKKRSDNNPLLYYYQVEDFVKSNAVSCGGLLLKGIQEENVKYGIQGPLNVQSELFHMECDSLRLQLCKCPEAREGHILVQERKLERKNNNPAQESDSEPIKNGWKERELFKNHLKRYSFNKSK